MSRYVAVVGPADADDPTLAAAAEVGRLLAARGCTVVTGGGSGVMAAAARAARDAGATVVGLLPGSDRADANDGTTVALPTGLGEGRNLLVVRSADGLVSLGGSWGTLSEIALACRTGVPVVSVGGWEVATGAGAPPGGPRHVATPGEAVEMLLRLLA